MQAALDPGALLTEGTAVAATLGGAPLADGTAVAAMPDGALEGTGASDDVAALGEHEANTRVRTTRRSFVIRLPSWPASHPPGLGATPTSLSLPCHAVPSGIGSGFPTEAQKQRLPRHRGCRDHCSGAAAAIRGRPNAATPTGVDMAMKYTGPLGTTHTKTAGEPADPAMDWVIEDLTEYQQVGSIARSKRWLGVAIAVVVAIVGFGFAGGLTTPKPPTTSPRPGLGDGPAIVAAPSASTMQPFEVTVPGDGARVDGSVVEVDGWAGRPLGTVHMAIRLGDAVLGWTNLEVPAAGPVHAAIRVFAPAFEVPVVLRVGGAPSDGGAAFETDVGLRLGLTTPVDLWRTSVRTDGTSATILVDGFGPMTARDLVVSVLAADDRVLGSTPVSIGIEDGRPGSLGGRLIGLGSFSARVMVGGAIPPGELTLVAAWRHRPTDTLREIRRTIAESSKPGVLR